MLKRYGVFAFGVFSYLVGVSSLVAWIGTMLGVIPFQYGVIDFTPNSIFISVLSCLVLTSTFAIQHTVMARGSFKRFVYKDIPVEAERSLFVLTTGIVLHGVLLFWPRNETLLWNIENETVAT